MGRGSAAALTRPGRRKGAASPASRALLRRRLAGSSGGGGRALPPADPHMPAELRRARIRSRPGELRGDELEADRHGGGRSRAAAASHGRPRAPPHDPTRAATESSEGGHELHGRLGHQGREHGGPPRRAGRSAAARIRLRHNEEGCHGEEGDGGGGRGPAARVGVGDGREKREERESGTFSFFCGPHQN